MQSPFAVIRLEQMMDAGNQTFRADQRHLPLLYTALPPNVLCTHFHMPVLVTEQCPFCHAIKWSIQCWPLVRMPRSLKGVANQDLPFQSP